MEKTKKKVMSKPVKIILCVLLAIILIVDAYVAYVFISFHLIEDHLPLDITDGTSAVVSTGTEYDIMSYNIGFGAYEPDFSFFMDGGKESWAFSKERLIDNMTDIGNYIGGRGADFVLVQEVDSDSTRTYHVDEREFVASGMDGYDYNWAQNYDSPFLFYPFIRPHGASRSGIMTFSKFDIQSSVRRSLPIESGVTKLVDLDRCYSVNRIPVDNGRELVLYNTHLSAYTSDGVIAVEQLEMLLDDMQAEYEKGNYCVCGGDMNKDITGRVEEVFGCSAENYTWAQPLPEGMFDDVNLSLVDTVDYSNPVPSCRNCDKPRDEVDFFITLDAFIVSDNVTVVDKGTYDLNFENSDHNPVHMTFVLN